MHRYLRRRRRLVHNAADFILDATRGKEIFEVRINQLGSAGFFSFQIGLRLLCVFD